MQGGVDVAHRVCDSQRIEEVELFAAWRCELMPRRLRGGPKRTAEHAGSPCDQQPHSALLLDSRLGLVGAWLLICLRPEGDYGTQDKRHRIREDRRHWRPPLASRRMRTWLGSAILAPVPNPRQQSGHQRRVRADRHCRRRGEGGRNEHDRFPSVDQRARARADRACECDDSDAGRLHPRPLAAAEQLGQLGGLFEEAGYAPLTPDWPDDPATIEEARANPDVLAKKTLKQVADHTTEIIEALDRKPVVIGHSTGGLLAEMLAGRGLAAATVAIDPGVFRGVLPLPGSVLKGVGPFLANPLTRGRAITLTFDQFKYGWANELDEDEAKELYDTFHVAGSGIALVQMGNANLNPWTESKVDTKNPDRGPLLIIDGENDHTVPWAIANAAYKRQRRNPGVTEIVKMPNRGHSLTIDHGWREVAETALAFVQRFT